MSYCLMYSFILLFHTCSYGSFHLCEIYPDGLFGRNSYVVNASLDLLLCVSQYVYDPFSRVRFLISESPQV